MKYFLTILVAVFLVFAMTACSATAETKTKSKDETYTQIDENTNDDSRPVKEFIMTSFTEVIDGKYFPQYSIKELNVNEGDMVRIKLTVTSGKHDFNLDEFDVSANTPLNEEVIIEFIADKKGSFEYYCSMPMHRENGHWGTLNVV